MHHCVGTYADRVLHGDFYVYSVRRNGERVATLALGRHEGMTYLGEIRGPCNIQPTKAIIATAQRWLSAQKPLPPRGPIRGADLKEVMNKQARTQTNSTTSLGGKPC